MSDLELDYIRVHIASHREEEEDLCPNALGIMSRLLADLEFWRE